MIRREAEKFVLVIFAFCLCFLYCNAYTGTIPADPENPGKCVYRGDSLKIGEHLGIAPCQRLTCHEDGSMLVEGCGKLRIDDCNRGERLHSDKPYPECCILKYKCKKSDGSTFYIERDVSDGEATKKAENST